MSSENKGIIESVTDYIAETAQAIGEWAGASSAEAKHKAKAEGHREMRDQDWNKATNSNESLTERAKGVGEAAKEEVKSLSEDAKKEKENQKAEHAKNKLTGNDAKSKAKKTVEGNNESITDQVGNYVSETVEAVGDWMSAGAKEAKHSTKEEGHKAARKAEWENAKSENSPGSAMDAAKEGAKELKEGIKKEYYDQKADNAANRVTN